MDDINPIQAPQSGRGISSSGKELGLVKFLEESKIQQHDKNGKIQTGDVPEWIYRKLWSLFSKDTRLANKGLTETYITIQQEEMLILTFLENDDSPEWTDPTKDPILELLNAVKLAGDIATRNKDGMERKQLDTTAHYTLGETHISEGQPNKTFFGKLKSLSKLGD